MGRLHGQARARLHLPGGRLGRHARRAHAARRRTGGRADRGRGRRPARDLVQPGRRRLAGVRQAVRAVHPAGRGERGPPGVRLAVPRAGRGVRPVRRPRRRAPSGGCAARSTSSPGGPGWPRWPRPGTPARTCGWSCTAGTATRPARTATPPRRTTTPRSPRPGWTTLVTWRTAPNKSALQHNKFLVLTRAGQPVAVWTGSTNLTQGAVFGHLNVGHLIGDPAVAQRFLDYWAQLADQTVTTAKLRLWTESTNPVDLAAAGHRHDPLAAGDHQPAAGRVRRTRSTAATSSAHITGAFGLNKVFRQRLGDRPGRRPYGAAGPEARRRAGDPDRRPGRPGLVGGLPAQGDVRAVGGRAPDRTSTAG